MNDVAIRAVDLVKRYPGADITALAGVSIDVARGQFFCIMGPSGSGKSTFLNMIGALDTPTSGDVILNGRPLSQERNLDAVRAKEVGFIFQLHNLLPTLTSIENVEIPMIALGVPRRERRRVSIARALANRAAVILGDEPTGDVLSKTGEQIMACIHEARRQS